MKPVVRARLATVALALVTGKAVAAPNMPATYGDWLLASVAARHSGLIAVAINANNAAGPVSIRRGPVGSADQTILPLADAMDHPIGTVSLTFKPGETDQARQVATEIGHRIYSVDGLGDAEPFVPGARRSVRGQALVEQIVDAHPDLVTLALHVAPDMNGENRIVASNFGRIGKPGDKDDVHVIADEATLTELTNGGARAAIELPLHDAAGRTIGALSTSFRIAAGETPEVIRSKAMGVRDELARSIPSRDWLKQ